MSYEYEIVTGYREYVERVNNLLSEGWTLQGGVSMIEGDAARGPFYAQAMTKETAVYEKEE